MLVRALLIAAGLLYGAQASAIALKDQFNLERQTYKVASSFYYVSFDEGSSESYTELERVLGEMDSELAAVETTEVEKLADVTNAWNALRKYSRGNNMKDEGYTDHYASVDLNRSREDLINILQSNVDQPKSLSLELEALKLAAEMQRLAMHYAEGSVSLLGFPYDELDVDAKKFGAELRAFEKKVASQKPDAKRAVSEALRAWVYIENALIQFYEINVPELVKRMNDVIVEKLVAASQS